MKDWATRGCAVLVLCCSIATHARADVKERCASTAEQAQDLRAKRQLLAARKLLISCSATECPEVVRLDCARWMAEVERSIPTLTLRAQDESGADVVAARITINGQRVQTGLDGKAIEVDPGRHRIRFEADGYLREERVVVVAEGEKSRLIVARLERREKPAPKTTPASASEPIAAYVIGGLGILALASFGYFEITAQQEYSELKDGCGRTSSCPEDDVDALRTRFVIAGISLGASAVLLGTSAALLLTSSSSEPSPVAAPPVAIFGLSHRGSF